MNGSMPFWDQAALSLMYLGGLAAVLGWWAWFSRRG